jgi:four helix bundle protein
MNNFKELQIWKNTMNLAVSIYALTKNLPLDEKYGLISQIKRSAVSIASNIAEGAGRNSKKEFLNFLSMAQESSYELMTQIILLKELDFNIDDKDIEAIIDQINHIQRMNFKLQKSLKQSLTIENN